MLTRTTALLLGSVLALGGCTEGTTWFQESGAFLNEGGFGTATRTNTLIQKGELNYVIDLNRRFAGEVPTMVTFAFDSAVLDAEARAILDRQADWIRQFPEVRFKVFGHTDLVGSNQYNYNLGLRRARAVVAYLVSHGISRSRLQAVVSYGETQPLIATQDRERRNRRTVTEVSGFVSRHPTILNGKYAEVIHREYILSARPAPATGAAETVEQ